MDLMDGNSHKEREKKAQVVEAQAQVSVHQKSFAERFAERFLSDDIPDIKTMVITVAKKTFLDAMSMLLLGKDEAPLGGYTRQTGVAVPYGSAYNGARQVQQNQLVANVTSPSSYIFGNLEFPNRGDADIVLDSMNDALRSYGSVSVMDMYDFAGIPLNNPQACRYGWRNLVNARIIRTTKGTYILKTPKAIPIE